MAMALALSTRRECECVRQDVFCTEHRAGSRSKTTRKQNNVTMQQWGVGFVFERLSGESGKRSGLSCRVCKIPGCRVIRSDWDWCRGSVGGRCRWVVTRGRSGGDDTGEEGSGTPCRGPRPTFRVRKCLNSTSQLNRLSLGLGLHL